MNTTRPMIRVLALIAALLLSVVSADPSTNVPPTITPTSVVSPEVRR